MLRHFIEMHAGEKGENVEFGIRVILESVKIQESREHNILNSKSEYNRYALLRPVTNVGENSFKKWEESQTKEKFKDLKWKRK